MGSRVTRSVAVVFLALVGVLLAFVLALVLRPLPAQAAATTCRDALIEEEFEALCNFEPGKYEELQDLARNMDANNPGDHGAFGTPEKARAAWGRALRENVPKYWRLGARLLKPDPVTVGVGVMVYVKETYDPMGALISRAQFAQQMRVARATGGGYTLHSTMYPERGGAVVTKLRPDGVVEYEGGANNGGLYCHQGGVVYVPAGTDPYGYNPFRRTAWLCWEGSFTDGYEVPVDRSYDVYVRDYNTSDYVNGWPRVRPIGSAGRGTQDATYPENSTITGAGQPVAANSPVGDVVLTPQESRLVYDALVASPEYKPWLREGFRAPVDPLQREALWGPVVSTWTTPSGGECREYEYGAKVCDSPGGSTFVWIVKDWTAWMQSSGGGKEWFHRPADRPSAPPSGGSGSAGYSHKADPMDRGESSLIANHAITNSGHRVPGIEPWDDIGKLDDYVFNTVNGVEFGKEFGQIPTGLEGPFWPETGNKKAYWDNNRQVIVIRDPGATFKGTVFEPTDPALPGRRYLERHFPYGTPPGSR